MISRALRLLAASALLATGAVHLQQYLGAGYSSIPTIGWLFLLNAISACIVAVGILLPLHSLLRTRGAESSIGLLAAVGASIAAASLVALLISENGTLFGFHESGYRPAIVAAIAAEVAALVTTLPLAVLCVRNLRGRPGEPSRSRSSPKGAYSDPRLT